MALYARVGGSTVGILYPTHTQETRILFRDIGAEVAGAQGEKQGRGVPSDSIASICLRKQSWREYGEIITRSGSALDSSQYVSVYLKYFTLFRKKQGRGDKAWELDMGVNLSDPQFLVLDNAAINSFGVHEPQALSRCSVKESGVGLPFCSAPWEKG